MHEGLSTHSPFFVSMKAQIRSFRQVAEGNLKNYVYNAG
jgi:hypothetical protein